MIDISSPKFIREHLYLDVVRGASEAYDQAVGSYSAGVNERSNKEIRRIHMLSVILRALCRLLNPHLTQNKDLW